MKKKEHKNPYEKGSTEWEEYDYHSGCDEDPADGLGFILFAVALFIIVGIGMIVVSAVISIFNWL